MKKARRIICILSCCFFAVNLTMPAYASEEVSRETVRVGFFSADGYHILDEDGTMHGYGFDFLQMLLRYNDWKYEYIGYEASWNEIVQMLDRGEIDMVTLADQTPERLEKYDFTEQPIGSSSTIMTVSTENEDIIPGEYDTYEGASIGLVEGSSHNAAFEEYAAEMGFSYTPIYYEDKDEMLEDLRANKNIEIAVTSNMRVVTEELILDEFNAHDYYAMVKKGNEQLLNELNNGITQLNVYSPNWKAELFKKYYSNINETAISFSAEERNYLQELKESGETIKVTMNPELKPYAYFENGEAKGIIPTIFKEITDRIGLPYEILYAKDRWEYKEQLDSGEAVIDMTAYLDYSLAQRYNLKETDAYMTTTLAMLSRKDSDTSENMVVAIVRDPTEYMGYNNELIYPYEYIEYESIQECIDAVKNGEADATFRYVYIAERAVTEDYTNKLQYRIMQGSTFGLTLGVNNEEDHRLLSVLNKGVNSLSEAYRQGIMLQEGATLKPPTTLLTLAYEYPGAIVAGTIIICGIAFCLILLVAHNKNQRNKLLASKEMERFIGYMCETYDNVVEIDIENMKRTQYALDGEELVKTELVYEPFSEDYFKNRVHPEDVERMTELFESESIEELITNGGGERYFECQVKDEYGAYNWYSYIIKAVPKNEQHQKSYVIFKKNIQETKASEEQAKQVLRDALENAQKASLAKGAFVSKISHEIRTPLNAIIGYLNMAEEEIGNTERVEHCVKNGKIASAHLLELINDVLDSSAIESNKMKIAKEEMDLKEMLISISAIYYNQTEKKGVKFSIELHNLIEEKLIGDALRVKQILVNLLSNASKFTAAGGSITLGVKQLKQIENQTHIQFQVTDTGVGMEESFLEHIFEAFEQENALVAQKYGGSGLGMSITKNLVDLMNGSINVTSEKNVGTTFTVVLPFERVLQTEEQRSAEKFSQIHVIVIEEENAVNYVKSLFKRCGAKCDVVTSKEKALKRIASRLEIDYEYQLCLINWKENGEGIEELVQQVKAQCGEKKPYMIALTYDVDVITDKAKELGVDEVIAKPLFQSTMYDFLVTKFGKDAKVVKEDANEKEEGLKGLHVLLAEDNEMNMEIAGHILGKAGMIITPATNGKEAYETFLQSEENMFDAILMDVQMPEMNGYEATKAIRSSEHPRAKSIPIVALTANAFAEDISNVLNAGMNDHVSKPIDEKKLYQVLKKYI